MMGAELLADMTADLDALMKRFRADLDYILETIGPREAARRLNVSTASIYHWTKQTYSPRVDSMRAVFTLAESLRTA
jgi:transposase